MGRNDMNHMQHLESVALSDCAVLESKEATYQGSWKRAGGGSAWFMARRNLDRLITMMSPKDFPDYIMTPANVRDTIKAIKGKEKRPGSPDATNMILDMLADRFTSEDIFMKIRENPGGEDGTVLACMRDARRYFTLVEAEMIAEGVVEPESKTYEGEHYPQDVYQMIADEKRLDRSVVKDLIHDLFYSDIGDKCRIMLLDGDAQPDLSNFSDSPPMTYSTPKATVKLNIRRGTGHDNGTSQYIMPNAENVDIVLGEEIIITLDIGLMSPPLDIARSPVPDTPKGAQGATGPMCHGATGGGYAAEQAARHAKPWKDKVGAVLRVGDSCTWKMPSNEIVEVQFVGVMDDLPMVRHGHSDVVAQWKDLRRDHTKENAKRDDGPNYETLFPWNATKPEFDALRQRVGNIADLFYTVRALGVYQLEPVVGSHTCPKELGPVYHMHVTDDGPNKWVLRRKMVPEEITMNFPLLQLEKNTKEYEEGAADFKFMYEFSEGDQKWKLKPVFAEWGRDVG